MVGHVVLRPEELEPEAAGAVDAGYREVSREQRHAASVGRSPRPVPDHPIGPGPAGTTQTAYTVTAVALTARKTVAAGVEVELADGGRVTLAVTVSPPAVTVLTRTSSPDGTSSPTRAASTLRGLPCGASTWHRDRVRREDGGGRAPGVDAGRPAAHVQPGGGRDAVRVGRPQHQVEPGEAGGERRPRVAQHLGRRPRLHHAAALEHGDAVAEQQGVEQVVGDEHRRAPDQHVAQHAPYEGSGRHVESGERLVEEQQPGVGREGPGDGDALRLPAGELGGPATGERVRLDRGQVRVGGGLRRAPRGAGGARAEGDVREDVEVREEQRAPARAARPGGGGARASGRLRRSKSGSPSSSA